MTLYSLFIIALTLLVAWTSLGLLLICRLEHRYGLRIVETTSAAGLFRLTLRWPAVLSAFHRVKDQDHA